jgi:hypothetical protein
MKLVTAAVIGVLALAPVQDKDPAKDLSWLAGRWEGASGGGTFEEHWTTSVGGVMIGMGRLVKGDKTIFTEFLKIVETKDGAEYRAIIDGQPETSFKLKSRSADEILFENPEHDFPQRIGYRKEKDGILAWIEGSQGGKTSKMEFRLKPKK